MALVAVSGEIRQGGDGPGEPAECGGVVVGPGSYGAVCRAPTASGLHPLFLDGARLTGRTRR